MRTPLGSARGELVIKRSRFLSFADPFGDPAGVKRYVESLRRAHPGCSHVVYAFVVGEEAERFGLSDYREPHGTAGRPVLAVLRGARITNVIVRVVRYFGGTKLGAGGLARAYSESAKLVVDSIATEELVTRVFFRLVVGYHRYDGILAAAAGHGGIVTKTLFESSITVEGLIPQESAVAFARAVSELTRGETSVDYTEK